MSLESLQQYVRIGGPAETPCLRRDGPVANHEPPCKDGVTVSPQVLAIREALWESCLESAFHVTQRLADSCPACSQAGGLVPRSRPEAALNLWRISRDILGDNWSFGPAMEGTKAGFELWNPLATIGRGMTPEDALSAALLATMKGEA